jgi:gliding motility-associatede transport system auxiliary component
VALTRVLTIARRDLAALLVSPAGWVVAALFVLLNSALGFVLPVLATRTATMDGVFGVTAGLLVPVLVPIITAQVFAGTRREATFEMVGGKWLGAFSFFVLLVTTTLLYAVLLASYVPGHLASLDLGLIGSTYAGLVITGGAATAIGALASSLAPNRVSAFFLALAVLLLTWYAGTLLGLITQAPLSGVAQYLAASEHYPAFGLGLVTIKDTIYLLSLGIAALFLAIRPRRTNLLPAGLALAGLIAFNFAGSRITVSWDLTHSEVNTLASQSVLAATRLNADLVVIGLFRPAAGNGQAEAEALVRLYQSESTRIRYRSQSFDADVVDVRTYSVREPNTLVLLFRGKTQLLTPPLQTERDFTAALLNLESDHVPLVCWAAGVGGASRSDTGQAGYSDLAAVLAGNNFATRDILMTGLTTVPPECDELVLIAPAVPLSAADVKAAGDYLDAGGSLLIAGDPWSQSPAAAASLNDVLKPYGLAFSGALVVEPDASRAFDVITPVTFVYGKSPITRDIQGIASVFPQATAITGTSRAGATPVVIASTGNLSYAIATPRQDLQRQSADVAGPFAIMETLEVPAGQKRARIAMAGTTGFAANRVFPPSSNAANQELVLGTFQWLAREDSLVSLAPKAPRAASLKLTQQDQSTIILIAIFLMPGVVILAGFLVVWRRRLIR